MTPPALLLAQAQRALQSQSKAEGARLHEALDAELALVVQRTAKAASGEAYVGLVRQKGRLQDALASLA